MRILIATDGALPVEHTVERVRRLHRSGDSVTVMTAINLPRRLLDRLQAVVDPGDASIPDIVDAAGPGHFGLAGGDRVAEQLARPAEQARPIDDVVARYREDLARSCLQPLLDALAAAGIEAEPLVRETEDRTAATIMDACRERRIDVLVIGSTGRGRFEGFVGSTGTKLFRHAPADVLLVRVPAD